MKYRTFFATLALFLITFHLGIFVISVTTFQDTVRRVQEKSLDDHFLITSMLLKDFQALESRNMKAEGSIAALLQTYSFFSGDRKVRLALYKGTDLVYSSGREVGWPSGFAEPAAGGERVVSMHKSDGRTVVAVSGMLPEPYETYRMVYQYDATEAFSSWKRTKDTMFWIAALLSVLLASGLLYLLHRIFQPLSLISKTSRDIAAGAFDTRLPVNGKDELSEMARSFNHMAEEIQRQMTELKEAAEKKQQFIDNFAHELRTPLTAIYGYAEYLQKAAASEDDRLSALQYIMSESRRLQTMANQLLELANLRHDQPEWKPQNVSDLFRHVQRTLHNKLAEKAIRIQWIREIDAIDGDGDLLRSLLVNLIDNAVNACDAGGHIVVRAAWEDGKKTVSVQDDGKGNDGRRVAAHYRAFLPGESVASPQGRRSRIGPGDLPANRGSPRCAAGIQQPAGRRYDRESHFYNFITGS